jgi:acetyltransferase
MQLLIDYATAEGLKSLCGEVLTENATMVAMCRELGFSIKADPNDAGIELVSLDLASRLGANDNAALVRRSVR